MSFYLFAESPLSTIFICFLSRSLSFPLFRESPSIHLLYLFHPQNSSCFRESQSVQHHQSSHYNRKIEFYSINTDGKTNRNDRVMMVERERREREKKRKRKIVNTQKKWGSSKTFVRLSLLKSIDFGVSRNIRFRFGSAKLTHQYGCLHKLTMNTKMYSMLTMNVVSIFRLRWCDEMKNII